MRGKRKLEVVAAVIRDGRGRTLACRRPEGKDCASLWEFPGGKIEPGETPPQALVRECLEELAIVVAAGGQVAETSLETAGASIHIRYIVARIVSGEIALLEHQDARWITAADAKTMDFCPSDSAVADAILADAVG